MAKVRVAQSGIHGRGVFASGRLRRGETAFVIRGPLVHGRRVTQRGIQVWRDWYIEPRSPARFVNHACRPNAEVTAALAVRARRPIARGQEITIDYSTVVLWEPWRMTCTCGDRACRRVVRAWARVAPVVRGRYPTPLFAWIEKGRVPSSTPAALRPGARAAASSARAAHGPGATGRNRRRQAQGTRARG